MIGNIDVFGFLWGIISNLIQPFVNFLVSFLPDGDPAIYAIIDGIGTVGGYSTFNVYYFCDWSAVLLCFGVLVTVILIVQVVKFILRALAMGRDVVEAIPIYE